MNPRDGRRIFFRRHVRLYSYFFVPLHPPSPTVIAADPFSDNIVPVFGMAGPIIFRTPSVWLQHEAKTRRRADNKNVKQMVVIEWPVPFAVKIE